jgi:hypothetical protein
MDRGATFSITIIAATANSDNIARISMVEDHGVESEHVQHNQSPVGELSPKQILKSILRTNLAQGRPILKALPRIGDAVQRFRLFIVFGARKFAHLITMGEGYRLVAKFGINPRIAQWTDEADKYIEVVIGREESGGEVEHQQMAPMDRAERTAAQKDNLSAICFVIRKFPGEIVQRRRLFRSFEDFQLAFSVNCRDRHSGNEAAVRCLSGSQRRHRFENIVKSENSRCGTRFESRNNEKFADPAAFIQTLTITIEVIVSRPNFLADSELVLDRRRSQNMKCQYAH